MIATGKIAYPVTANMKLAADKETNCFKNDVFMIGLSPVLVAAVNLSPSTYSQPKVETGTKNSSDSLDKYFSHHLVFLQQECPFVRAAYC